MAECQFCGEFGMRVVGQRGLFCSVHWPVGGIRDWGRVGTARRAFLAWREDHVWYGRLARAIRRRRYGPGRCPVDGYRAPHRVMGWRTGHPLDHHWP
jgi:hypothetical protein